MEKNDMSLEASVERFEVEKRKVIVTPDGKISRHNTATYLDKAYSTICEWERERQYGLKGIRVGRHVYYLFAWIKLIAEGKVNKDGSLVDQVGEGA